MNLYLLGKTRSHANKIVTLEKVLLFRYCVILWHLIITMLFLLLVVIPAFIRKNVPPSIFFGLFVSLLFCLTVKHGVFLLKNIQDNTYFKNKVSKWNMIMHLIYNLINLLVRWTTLSPPTKPLTLPPCTNMTIIPTFLGI